MKHSDAPWKELKRAEAELEAMKTATDVHARLHHWVELLRAVDRLWNKSEGWFSRSPKWKPWQGRYVRLRRTDELLKYMLYARNVEEHSAEPSAVVAPGATVIGRGSQSVFIDELRIDSRGQIAKYKGSHPLEVIPPTVVTRVVDNRGVVVKPPTMHLGKPMTANVMEMGEAGLAFYRAFLEAAEAAFVDEK